MAKIIEEIKPVLTYCGKCQTKAENGVCPICGKTADRWLVN